MLTSTYRQIAMQHTSYPWLISDSIAVSRASKDLTPTPTFIFKDDDLHYAFTTMRQQPDETYRRETTNTNWRSLVLKACDQILQGGEETARTMGSGIKFLEMNFWD